MSKPAKKAISDCEAMGKTLTSAWESAVNLQVVVAEWKADLAGPVVYRKRSERQWLDYLHNLIHEHLKSHEATLCAWERLP